MRQIDLDRQRPLTSAGTVSFTDRLADGGFGGAAQARLAPPRASKYIIEAMR